ncbi:1-phosphatidylinositol 4-kinase [Malassezia psittaci]|uniref:1-phosphatidylinositol 4-kinase n=1 Tax=Malassezia psittaci TaxID=1821823 RepID=A0AAF0F493_9BASI|nr:1-phosphatidylinositol 4-kinase [Malassezia psittaci]
MDILDQPTHTLILTDIAENLALGAADGTLSSEEFGLLRTSAATSDANGRLTTSCIRTYLAQARFASAAVDAMGTSKSGTPAVYLDEILSDLKLLTSRLNQVQWESTCQLPQDWPVPDEVAFALTEALLKIASVSNTYRSHALPILSDYAHSLLSKITSSQTKSDALITSLVPQLHGLARAMQNVAFSWTQESYRPFVRIFASVSTEIDTSHLDSKLIVLPEQRDAAAQCNQNTIVSLNADGNQKSLSPNVCTILQQYAMMGVPLSSRFVMWCALSVIASLLAQTITQSGKAYAAAWAGLQREQPSTFVGIEMEAIEAAQQIFEQMTKTLAEITSTSTRIHTEIYARELLSTALKVTVLCAVAYKDTSLGPFVPETIASLLGDEAVLYDELLQQAAVESCAVLANVHQSIVPNLISTLRKFVQLPLPLLESDLACGSPLLNIAGNSMATCVQYQGEEAAASLTYSLLNSIARSTELAAHSTGRLHHVRGVRPAASEQSIITENTVVVITSLAKALGDVRFTMLAISLLLQRLQSHAQFTQTPLLTHLVPLALIAPTSSFVNVMDYLSEAADVALGARDNVQLAAIHTAQQLLARGMTADAERQGKGADETVGEHYVLRKGLYLNKLLASAIEAGAQHHREAILGHVRVLAALLAHQDFNPQYDPTTAQVYLFRNLWAAIGTSGVAIPLTPTMPPNEPLSVIALKTPILIPASVINYIEEDIEYNSMLKQEVNAAGSDSVRRSLVPYLGARMFEGGKVSQAKLVFLQAVLEVEWRRSVAGRPSWMLFYFAHHGLAASSLAAPLQTIAERVFSSFLIHVSRCTEAHSVGPHIYQELQNLLVAACHNSQLVRQTAHAYLERLATGFPELFARPEVVVTMLELLSLLAKSCDGEMESVYLPEYYFSSSLANVKLVLTDSYIERKQILTQFYAISRSILARVHSEMPQELGHVLLRYLQYSDSDNEPIVDGLGKTVALDFARGLRSQDPLSNSPVRHDASGVLTRDLVAQSIYSGEVGIVPNADQREKLTRELAEHLAQAESDNAQSISMDTLRTVVYRAGASIIHTPHLDFDLIHYLVALPMAICTKSSLLCATQAWAWVMTVRSDTETAIISEIATGWGRTIDAKQGIYSSHLVARDALLRKTDMSSFDRAEITAEETDADVLFTGHRLVLQLLLDRLQASRSGNPALVTQMTALVRRQVDAISLLSTHPLMRTTYHTLALFCLRVLSSSHLDAMVEVCLRDGVCRLALHWFTTRAEWAFGGDRKRAVAELQILREVQQALRTANLRADSLMTSSTVAQIHTPTVHSAQPLTLTCTMAQGVSHVQLMLQLLRSLYQHEEYILNVWLNPTADEAHKPAEFSIETLHAAWMIDAVIAAQVVERSHSTLLATELGKLVRAVPHRAIHSASTIDGILAEHVSLAKKQGTNLKWLNLWAPVKPVQAIELLQPGVGGHPLVLQYAMRVLEEHPTDLVFFYIPQLVQALREDTYGYVAQFISKTSLISQLFCHQILWNMDANKYKDDNAEVPDPLKPTLDKMGERILEQLSGDAKDFYEREFSFFNEVTSISGTLKPYIKKSKAEKKAKIDEEMAKIRVDPGVYLPSNPDGVVVGLDRKSGRPLQSHAKAPFMATFLVRRPEGSKLDAEGNQVYHDVWQSAIFKVGDDCRQDVLALQVIAQFKNIYMSIGLDVYLDPYRVTATAPGCGVIDVVPNATSRDEMGRQKINDLVDFFHTRFGLEHTVGFQKARLNFIQSMAAYSVVCHILQIRDRHNGNIMIDGEGHLVHIDFGFLFDIGPGGMRFEPYSFKLSLEMVAVMGGAGSPGFRMFEQLVVKAFLACRPYVDQIVSTCALMLGTDLPSFKGPSTFQRLRDRFKPNLDEREAAKHAANLVKDAYGNRRAVLYDLLQEKQNHIPYRK